MSKAFILFFIVVFTVSVMELKPLSVADVECKSQPGGCAAKEVNPRPKRQLLCLYYPLLCTPQYVPVQSSVTTVYTSNITNGHGDHNSVTVNLG